MPQTLRNISLQLRDGPARQAVAVGNNAAWLCPCVARRYRCWAGHMTAQAKRRRTTASSTQVAAGITSLILLTIRRRGEELASRNAK